MIIVAVLMIRIVILNTSVGSVYLARPVGTTALCTVALDRISTSTTHDNDEDEFIDDENIHEGDEHTRQITG